MNPKDNLVPLPLDPMGQASPLNSSGRLPDVGSKDPLDAPSPTEAWLADHPNGFDENEAPKPVEPPIPLDADDESEPLEVEREGDDAPAVPVAEADDAPAPAVKAKADEPKAEEKPPTGEAKPAEPPKPTYAADEKLALAEGVEWTRQQVVDALQERVALQPKAAAAEQFEKIFRMDAAKAAEVWAPVIDRIANDPSVGPFLAAYFDDPQKKEYLDQCARYFDEATPQTERQQPQAAAPVNPELKRQIDELSAWKQERERQDAVTRFNSEVEVVRARYPFVVADPALFNELRETAHMMWQQDQKKGLLDALAVKAALYDALAIARQQREAPPAAPAAPSVPALPSSGAAPAASRRTSNRPRTFKDVDEATQAWLQEHPGDYEG